MEYQKKFIIGMILIAGFVLIIGISSFYVQMQIDSGNVCGCLIPITLFIPFLGSVGLLIGTLVYYFFNPFHEENIDGNVFLSLFESDEMKVMKMLINSGGKASQARIVRETNLSKVKVFRILEKLSRKDVVSKESLGKTNNVTVNKKMMKCFR
ncbi:MAG: hypothetical protein JW789_00605 [Candidatus Aenigmarchaeota archaeon]|nr:hypothetical protein [Candidatus Aenigmarchaeota archaeon]